MKTIAIIPARMGSQRLPGKPLIVVKGKPIIQYVWENTNSPLIDFKIVATDDEKILQVVKDFGGEAILTSTQHQNGSERCAEVLETYHSCDIILNIQGDEPMVNEAIIKNLLDPFKNNPKMEVSTLRTPINTEQLSNPNIVKVVCDHRNYALYFSRSPIPFNRDKESSQVTYYKHLGFYAFRREILIEYVKMPPSYLESIEKLEQLRLLEAGKNIYVSECLTELIDINTEKDLKKFKSQLNNIKPT